MHGCVENSTADLGEYEFNEIQTLVWEARGRWWNIGIQLCFSTGDLEAIEINHVKNCGRCFTNLLTDWIQRNNPIATWKALINALTARTVGIKVNFRQDSQGKYIGSCLFVIRSCTIVSLLLHMLVINDNNIM